MPKHNKTRKSSSSKPSLGKVQDDIFIEFSKIQLALKLFHFQCPRYGQHKASDSLYDKLLEHMDKFLEVAQGICGRISLQKLDIQVTTMTPDNIAVRLSEFSKYLEDMDKQIANTDLLNIRDELLADVHQTQYLLTFL